MTNSQAEGNVRSITTLNPETRAFADEVADSVTTFLLALKAIASQADPGRGLPLLLLEVSQLSLTGARLGAHADFTPTLKYQPDVGEEADLDEVRLAIAEMLGEIDTYSFVFDPYLPEVVEGQLSDDLASIASDLENGLRHYRLGNLVEALWWWQFSYLSSWGNLAGAVLNALIGVHAHDRLDVDVDDAVEAEQIRTAEEVLG